MIPLVPPMRIRHIVWSNNTAYATRRATIAEIEEVLLSSESGFRRNLRGRAATHVATGRTAAGRSLTVAFIYRAATRSAIPINAGENR